MSVYVYFELGGPDGLRSRFLDDAKDFERWLRGLAREFSGEYPPGKLTRIADIAQKGAEALTASDPGAAQVIDSLTHDYWNFCTMTGRHGDKDITPAGRHAYPAELSQVLPAASSEACDYYRRLFAGNSLAECNDHTFRSPDGVFRWSWLLPQEVEDFCNRLQDHADLLESDNGVREILSVLRLAKEARSSLLISIA